MVFFINVSMANELTVLNVWLVIRKWSRSSAGQMKQEGKLVKERYPLNIL